MRWGGDTEMLFELGFLVVLFLNDEQARTFSTRKPRVDYPVNIEPTLT